MWLQSKLNLNLVKDQYIFVSTGICRSDVKRPDGMTVGFWKLVRHLVRDETCTDSVTTFNLLVSMDDSALALVLSPERP